MEEANKNICFLYELENIINDKISSNDGDSYTKKLFEQGINRMAQKVGEEGVEVAISASTDSDNLLEESADLLYHLLVLLRAKNKSIDDVIEELKKRRK